MMKAIFGFLFPALLCAALSAPALTRDLPTDPAEPEGPKKNHGTLAIPIAAISCITPPAGMVAWWHFDEPGGTMAEDLAITNNPGTHIGLVTPVPGMVAGARTYNGGYTMVADHNELDFDNDSYSIDIWVKPDQVEIRRDQTLVDKRDLNCLEKGYRLFMRDHTLILRHADGIPDATGATYTDYVSTALVTPGSWHLVAVVVTAPYVVSGHVDTVFGPVFFNYTVPGSVKFFLDGVLVTALPHMRTGSISNSSDLMIGADANASQRLQGSLDELELFNRPLTEQEVLDLYTAGPDGKCKNTNSLRSDSPKDLPPRPSLAENGDMHIVGVSPIPAISELHIRIQSNFHGVAQMEMYDMLGNKIGEAPVPLHVGTQQKPVDISDLDAGTYIIKLSSEGETISSRFIKAE